MTTREEALFGRIALDLRLVTDAQLREALVEQAHAPVARLVGAILVEKGHLTQEGLEQVLLTQREALVTLRGGAEWKAQDASFGRTAIQLGFLQEEDLDPALVEQFRLARQGLLLGLGEILVAKGRMTETQARKVRRAQENRFVTCEGCGSRYRILDGKEGLEVPCKKCGRKIRLTPSATG